MPYQNLVRRWQAFLFVKAQEGVAVVEFVIILPFMAALLLGMTDLTLGISTDRKITQVTRTVADLTSRQDAPITNARMNDIFAASRSVMAPYSDADVSIRLSSIVVESAGGSALRGRVCWSTARGSMAALGANSIVSSIPNGFGVLNTSYIFAEVSKNYTPVFNGFIPSIALSENVPWPVRNVREVTLQGQAPCLP